MTTEPQTNTDRMQPDDPSLRVSSRPPMRKLKKGPIFVLLTLTALVLTTTVVLALQRPVHTEENTPAAVIDPDAQNRSMPDSIRDAASDYGQLDYSEDETPEEPTPEKEDTVPTIGPPLFGDMGGIMKNTASTAPVPIAPVAPPVQQPPQPTPEELERQRRAQLAREAHDQAMRAGLFFQAGGSATPTATLASNNSQALLATQAGTLPTHTTAGQRTATSANRDPNLQAQKQQFLANGMQNEGYLKAQLQRPVSPYEVKAGTIIPATLITGINSDLPGMIIAQVRERVFDTATGRHLLIPQGSRLIGSYSSDVSYGQSRALVVWSRLILPNSASISLENMPGIDQQGYAGYSDQVNHHWGRLSTGIILSSLLAGTAQQRSNNTDDFRSRFSENVGEEINRAGQRLTRKNLDIQPTIAIRPGHAITIMVHKDMILTPYQHP